MKPKPKCDCIHRCRDSYGHPYCSAFDRAIEHGESCNGFCCEYSDDENDED